MSTAWIQTLLVYEFTCVLCKCLSQGRYGLHVFVCILIEPETYTLDIYLIVDCVEILVHIHCT